MSWILIIDYFLILQAANNLILHNYKHLPMLCVCVFITNSGNISIICMDY